jgi:hypothetical protein
LDCLQKTEVYGPFYEKYRPLNDEGRVVNEVDPPALWSAIKNYFKSTDDSVQRSSMNRSDQLQIGDEEIHVFINEMDDIICLINPPMTFELAQLLKVTHRRVDQRNYITPSC